MNTPKNTGYAMVAAGLAGLLSVFFVNHPHEEADMLTEYRAVPPQDERTGGKHDTFRALKGSEYKIIRPNQGTSGYETFSSDLEKEIQTSTCASANAEKKDKAAGLKVYTAIISLTATIAGFLLMASGSKK